MPAKENSKRKAKRAELEIPTAEEIFDKPPAPPPPLSPAWTDDSIARQLADDAIAETLLDEIIHEPPPAPAPAKKEKKKSERVIEDALSRIVDAQTILDTHYPEPMWAVKGVIPEGTTFIAGPPKLGKSIFCLNIAVAVAEGGKALSYFDVERGSVLYLALEDSERRIQKRLKQLVTRQLSGNLKVATKWPRLNLGGLEAIEAWAQRRDDARLLIVDTFKMLRPIRQGVHNNVNAYDLDYEDVAPLTEFASANQICLVIVTHTRKAMADDPLATVSGSFGLTGAADGVLVLARQRNSRTATLTVIGRDVEEQELALEFSPDIYSWAVLGKSESVKQRDERSEILDLLQDSDEPLSPGEIAVMLDRPRGAIRMRLLRMRRDRELSLFGRGNYHLPNYEPRMKQTIRNGYDERWRDVTLSQLEDDEV